MLECCDDTVYCRARRRTSTWKRTTRVAKEAQDHVVGVLHRRQKVAPRNQPVHLPAAKRRPTPTLIAHRCVSGVLGYWPMLHFVISLCVAVNIAHSFTWLITVVVVCCVNAVQLIRKKDAKYQEFTKNLKLRHLSYVEVCCSKCCKSLFKF